MSAWCNRRKTLGERLKEEADHTHHTSIGNKEFTYKLKKVSRMQKVLGPFPYLASCSHVPLSKWLNIRSAVPSQIRRLGVWIAQLA